MGWNHQQEIDYGIAKQSRLAITEGEWIDTILLHHPGNYLYKIVIPWGAV